MAYTGLYGYFLNSNSDTLQWCITLPFGTKHTFPDGNHRTYQTLPIHRVYAPTGDIEKFSIATYYD